MIPKIIHLCWLSGDPYPTNIQKCIDSWKEKLPDYEICLWNTERFDVESTVWTKQAFAKKKYAFAADYIRLYALYNYGGIYLDSDVFVYKSFNELLDLPYFVGQDYERSFEAAVIGAEKGCEWIGKILEYYNGRSFILPDGSLDMTPLPQIFFKQLKNGYSFVRLHKIVHFANNENQFYVYDKDFFNSRNSCVSRRTKKSFCTHNYAGAWLTRKGVKSKIKRTIPKWLLNMYLTICHKTFKRNALGQFEPKIEQEIW